MTKTRFDVLAQNFDVENFKNLNKTMSFGEYLDEVYRSPALARSAYQRLYDMILQAGTGKLKDGTTTYNFFSDKEIPIFGIEKTLDSIVKTFKGAAGYYGAEKRIILLCGPVGSAKSTICRLLKKGLEEYSCTDEGALYSFSWVNIPEDLDTSSRCDCPMNEDPLRLIPVEMRSGIEKDLNNIIEENFEASQRENKDVEAPYKIRLEGHLDPQCQFMFDALMKLHDGDWQKMVNQHIEVRRITISEDHRRGIGTFQPKDEKNQDSTELTGDINYRKLAEFGRDSDPRAFSFDGEFNIANRGIIEFIEILKLDKAFLYDLLGAAQERKVKPKKFAQVDIDTVIIGHTNMPEYSRVKADNTMEAFKDRTIVIEVPYLLEWSKEQEVLNHDYGKGSGIRQHIAPHTLEIAALWAVLTRLKPVKDSSCTLVEKAKLYDHQGLDGWNDDKVKEMQLDQNEGLDRGMSARFIQNSLSNLLSGRRTYVNPFMLMNELESRIATYPNATEENKAYYLECITYTKQALDEILKDEVQRALSADSGVMDRLCANYIDNLFASIDGTKVKDGYTGKDQEPNERLMRGIESHINVTERESVAFRTSIATFIGGMRNRNEVFDWKSNQRLRKALESYNYEMCRDQVKLSSLNIGAEVVDPDTEAKINAIKERMKKNYGYNDESATDVLNYVSSIFARGDLE